MIRYEPGPPLSCAQLRALDQEAADRLGVPTLLLMENAARSVAEFSYELLPHPRGARVVVLCGAGNNGGDGLAAARHLTLGGCAVEVVLAEPAERMRGDAAVNLAIWQRTNGRVIQANAAAEATICISQAEMILDGLLGTGASGAPRGRMAQLIQEANAAAARRVAIDIPTGLEADSGRVYPPCFAANLTVTFVAAKLGFSAPAARAALGRVVVAAIGVPGLGRANVGPAGAAGGQ